MREARLDYKRRNCNQVMEVSQLILPKISAPAGMAGGCGGKVPREAVLIRAARLWDRYAS